MTVGAILAIALIGAAATWLGMEIFRRIVKAHRAKRIRDQWASQWSGDAGGWPKPDFHATAAKAVADFGDADMPLSPPSAWRGTGARRR